MVYTVTYILDRYEYEMVDGYRADNYFDEDHLDNGEWLLTEDKFNSEHLTRLMMEVFNRYAPKDGVVMDRIPSYVIDELEYSEAGDEVMVEYDMCLSVEVNGEELSEQDSYWKLYSLGFKFS